MATLPFPPTALATASSAPTLIYASGSTLHVGSASASAGETSAKAQATGLIRKVALSADGTLAVSAGDDKTLRVWDVKASELVLRSTRQTLKRVACLSLTPENDILITDKVGDVFLYPLEPRVAGERAQGFKEQADPSLNPDADFLLGHVSIVSQHVLVGNRIITADRDEHIRVSRFPKSYVIDKYCWGSEGFVSAIHVPASRPNLVVSGGGEPTLQVFDWTTGALLRRIDIFPTVLDYRRVRTSARKIKSKKRAEFAAAAAAAGPPASDDPKAEGFCVAPPGMQYPVGLNVCIEAISSVVVGGQTVIIFFSEGCTAIHSLVLPENMEDEGEVKAHSFPTSHPVLGFSRVPGSDSSVVVALDATYGVKKDAENVDDGLAKGMFVIVDIAADGSLAASTSQESLLSSLTAPLEAESAAVPVATVAALSLYPNLGLFPRWPGFEEDEELAGPETGASTPGGSDFESLAPKQLGRLKSKGMDVTGLMRTKRRKGKKGSAVAVASEEAKEEAEGAEA